MRRQAVTLKDVARAAKVSPSTASEALSGTGRMTEATREAVIRAARALDYRPNAVARGLRTGILRSIALHHVHAGDRFASDYFREFVTGVLDGTQAQDYDLTLLSSNPAVPRNRVPRVDGVIIADPIADDLRAHELLRSGLPVVAGEHFPPGMPTCPVVAADHGAALREILDHALREGARRPAFVGPDANSGWGVLLRAEFLAWCEEHDLPGITRESRFLNLSVAEHTAMLTELLLGEPEIDLLVVSSEAIALGALDALRALGRAPGADVLLACCGEGRTLSAVTPTVTGVDMRPRELGLRCAQLLIRLIEEDESPAERTTVLPARVRWRESTARREAVRAG
ncbi:LacI family DNA-binding transcriptional regulator [Streptomyces millisiae]|uniref:LacI family DNA-binding transcriptional regulator n=1 Tax=Streptomyces millisiae TaxID=3075542 RepID=A0ABU2LMW3_9ACTN|nr:LacI family DNA-binding transcriptional regulator [Streptomyces sp. DSM 44918]MDT0318893.1 LacI family DNA-binding transcriptional regulator [Streptomyces sp. DSM 44918]